MAPLEAREALPAVLRAIPDATMLIAEPDEIQLVNGRLAQLVGYSEAELMGQPFHDLVAARDRSRLKTALASGRGTGEFLARRKDGTELELRFCLNAVNTGAIGRRAFVLVLRPKEPAPYEARLLAGAPDALVVVHQDGRIVLINDRVKALFGYEPGELLGLPVEALLPGEKAVGHVASRTEYFRDPHVRPMHAPNRDFLGRKKDGTVFPVDIMLSPVSTDGGVVAIAAVRDATDRKALEDAELRLARAEEAVKLRDEFVSLVAHELRTPLTALRLQVDRLRRDASRAGVGAEFIAALLGIGAALGRTEFVVDELVDASRIVADGMTLKRQPVDLREIVQSECDRIRKPSGSADLDLTITSADPMVGMWDRSRLRQLVRHLLSNAVKYGKAKPIGVVLERNGEDAILTVRDEGIGVAPDDRAKLFDRFARFASSRHYGGLGLGLWFVREVVEAHGGRVAVSSDGAGAVFRVALPLALDSDHPRSGAAAAPGGQRGSRTVQGPHCAHERLRRQAKGVRLRARFAPARSPSWHLCGVLKRLFGRSRAGPAVAAALGRCSPTSPLSPPWSLTTTTASPRNFNWPVFARRSPSSEPSPMKSSMWSDRATPMA